MLITPIYASFLGLIFVFLAFRVIRLRRRLSVGIGSDESMPLKRASRVHANFAEYVPMSLILLFFLEQIPNNQIYIHIMGAALILGRMIHAYGVSQVNEKLVFRVTGMILTFSVIISASTRILISYL